MVDSQEYITEDYEHGKIGSNFGNGNIFFVPIMPFVPIVMVVVVVVVAFIALFVVIVVVGDDKKRG